MSVSRLSVPINGGGTSAAFTNMEYVMAPIPPPTEAPPPPLEAEVLPSPAKEEGPGDVPPPLPPKQKAQANKGHRSVRGYFKYNCDYLPP